MAGGGTRRGTLVHHYGTDHRPTSAPGPRQPQTKQGPAVADPRIRVRSTVVFGAAPGHARSSTGCLASEPIGRRALMRQAMETGHESGRTQTGDTLRRGAVGRRLNTTPGRSEGSDRQRRTTGCWPRSLGSHPPGPRQRGGPGGQAAEIMPRAGRSWRGRCTERRAARGTLPASWLHPHLTSWRASPLASPWERQLN